MEEISAKTYPWHPKGSPEPSHPGGLRPASSSKPPPKSRFARDGNLQLLPSVASGTRTRPVKPSKTIVFTMNLHVLTHQTSMLFALNYHESCNDFGLVCYVLFINCPFAHPPCKTFKINKKTPLKWISMLLHFGKT